MWKKLVLGSCFAGTVMVMCPAFAVDLTVVNLEVTQGIQTPGNTIQLVAQRSTAVRTTIGVSASGSPVGGVTGRLHIFVDAIRITPAAGLAAVNAPFTAPLAPNRANENDTLNFEITAPTGISASADVDFLVDIDPVAGETDLSNNSGSANNLSFENRTTPLIYFTRMNYTPAAGGFPPLSDVQPGVGDAFIQGILPVNDGDLAFYQEANFPESVRTINRDTDGDGILDCYLTPADGNALLNFIEECRQLIVNGGVGAGDHVFLYSWFAGNPTDCNGLASIGGRVAFGNTEPIRYQRTFAHELGHNFGQVHSDCAVLDEVGWDVGARLSGNPAGNNASGRVKPTSLTDISCPGELTDSAFVNTDSYNELLVHGALNSRVCFETDALVVQGIFNEDGTSLLELNPVFRYPWFSQPTTFTGTSGGPPFRIELIRGAGTFITRFDARIGDDVGGLDGRHGAFTAVVPPFGDNIDTLRITDTSGAVELGRIDRSLVSPRVIIRSPAPGDRLSSTTRVSWDVVDPDTPADDMRYQVAYSPDDGRSFVPVGVGLTQTELTFDARQIPSSLSAPRAGRSPRSPRSARGRQSESAGLIRVFVTDGLNTSFSDVNGLSTPPRRDR